MPRPDIVLIMTDTQGANVVGCYGRPELRTPNLDRLAAEGIRFDRAYTTCPVCTPARAGIFTGLHPTSAGAFTNGFALMASTRHMGQIFRDAGYRTGYIGKWHLAGLDYFDSGICPDGWDDRYWYDGRRYLDDLTPEQVTLWRTGLTSARDLRRHGITAEFTWAHRVSDKAAQFVAARDTRPFLLVLSYDEPHGPCTCPAEYVEAFQDYRFPIGPSASESLENKPAHQQEWAALYRDHPLPIRDSGIRLPMYFGCNSFVDAEIGRAVEQVLRQAPDNTWIVFTSDHGDLLGAHRMTSKGPIMYEEVTRIPFIVRPPGGSRRPRVVSQPVGHTDILPTLLELAGLPCPSILNGTSLAAGLAGEDAIPEHPVFMEFTRFEVGHDGVGGFQPIRSIVSGNLKLTLNLLHTDELYDLAGDPAEMENRINDAAWAEARDGLHDRLLAWMNETRDPFRGACWERRPWRTRRTTQWMGPYRPRPDDGYLPAERNYRTGKPFGDAQGD